MFTYTIFNLKKFFSRTKIANSITIWFVSTRSTKNIQGQKFFFPIENFDNHNLSASLKNFDLRKVAESSGLFCCIGRGQIFDRNCRFGQIGDFVKRRSTEILRCVCTVISYRMGSIFTETWWTLINKENDKLSE